MCNMLHWQCFLKAILKRTVGIKILISWSLHPLTLFADDFFDAVMMTINRLESPGNSVLALILIRVRLYHVVEMDVYFDLQ